LQTQAKLSKQEPVV